MYISNFNFLAQFKEHFFEVKNGGNPHISPPNQLGELILEYVIQILIFYQLD